MKRGFSLIELLVVITIIAILVGIAAPYYSDYVKESKLSKCKADLDILRQAVILYNAREDIPYQGLISTTTPFLPILGDNDFVGLQGQYLTNIPLDPWGKNYKLDPYGAFVYSDGPDSRKESDNIRDYYVKELAIRKIEWEDANNDRQLNDQDIIYLHFNKSVWVDGTVGASDFLVFENNEKIGTITFNITMNTLDNPGYSLTTATQSTLVCRVNGNANLPKIGVHAIALDDTNINTLRKYQEVVVDRDTSINGLLFTKVEKSALGYPLRFALRTAPVKITPKN